MPAKKYDIFLMILRPKYHPNNDLDIILKSKDGVFSKNLDYSNRSPRLQKPSDSGFFGIMPPIVSVKSKMVTPCKMVPLKVSYENFNRINRREQANASMISHVSPKL